MACTGEIVDETFLKCNQILQNFLILFVVSAFSLVPLSGILDEWKPMTLCFCPLLLEGWIPSAGTGEAVMPIYEYQAKHETTSCAYCAKPFERLQRIADPPISACPQCGAPVSRIISAPAVGSSKTAFDRRAQQAGFTKLQRLGKGEYEKKY